jgi:hypothetical protein
MEKKINTKGRQVCVWPGTIVGDDVKKFEKFMFKNFEVRVQYLKEIKTLPSMRNGEPVRGTGNRNDLFFAVYSKDMTGKFCLQRLQYGIRWIEDVLDNESDYSIYPAEVREWRTW